MGDDTAREIEDAVGEIINADLAEMQADFDRLAATLVGRPDDEITEALTHFGPTTSMSWTTT